MSGLLLSIASATANRASHQLRPQEEPAIAAALYESAHTPAAATSCVLLLLACAARSQVQLACSSELTAQALQAMRRSPSTDHTSRKPPL